MLILNTGGTFNKRYNPVNGELFVPRDEMAIEKIVATLQINMRIQGILHKDSLEMDNEDRATLCENIVNAKEDIVIIVHGTDTMELSAQAVRELNLGKRVVFTGAMIPFAIDPLEATANLAMAIGYATNCKSGVYIVMQGVCGEYDTIIKNKAVGKFEYV
jgi:L-asparaginase